jgi:sulfonate transport system substrate-binding protein
VHYLLVRLLEKNGLKLSDITPVYLPPADARAAFETKAVDAWVIWDPYTAAAEKQLGARVLADATGVASNHQFYLGERGYVEKNPQVIRALFDDSVEKGQWLKAHPHEAAELIAPLQGLPVEVVEASLRRYEFAVKPLTPAVIAEQQKIADTFADLKLIPKPVSVREATWQGAQ